MEGLEMAAGIACALGCDGKWAIHPTRIETINRIFSPFEEEIQRTKKKYDIKEFYEAKAFIEDCLADIRSLKWKILILTE